MWDCCWRTRLVGVYLQPRLIASKLSSPSLAFLPPSQLKYQNTMTSSFSYSMPRASRRGGGGKDKINFAFHAVKKVESESLLKPILSADEISGRAPKIPEDLCRIIKKHVAIGKHLERNRKDKASKFGLKLVKSRIDRLARYYKKTKKLPPLWKYGRNNANDGPRRGGGVKNRIIKLGRLLTKILREMASELNLNMQSDGYVKVEDLLKLNLKTLANVPLKEHSVDEIKEAVRRNDKLFLSEEKGELLIRFLKPILSVDEIPVCVHGTYERNLESILETGLKRMQRLHVHFSCGLPTDGEAISGTRQDVNVLIYLDVKKALEEGMKLYISTNRVILAEGFDGVVPLKYFKKIQSWPDRKLIPFQLEADWLKRLFN